MSSLIAIDPGSNRLGLAFFQNGVLKEARSLTTQKLTPLERRLDMAGQLTDIVMSYDAVASEEPLLMGRNNNFMQRLLGCIEFMTNGKVKFVHPMTLKKFTGSGSSDKLDMALAVGEMLKTEEEKEIMARLIEAEDFDATDAVCVGLWALNG